jgi:hypothetical protein
MRPPRYINPALRHPSTQIAARLVAEAGNHPELGPAVHPAMLQATVAHILHQRGIHNQTQRQQQQRGRRIGPGGGRIDSLAAEDAALLRAAGCPDQAAGIFKSLRSWLGEQAPCAESPEGQEESTAAAAGGSAAEAAAVAASGALLALRRLGGGGGAGSAANAAEGPEAVADVRLSLVSFCVL